ncbi:hypothetical protein B0H14DRAFT_2574824 [Mycena olivaceomarginata]|nr:hypothetical protein B0H14DRAFT_2574824 [Mycena olivaceomarginata]
MPRAGTAARRREHEGRSPAKPGKVGWVHGTKLPFFQAHKDEFLAAAEIKGTGAFYEKIAHLYLAKYGYNLDWHEDLHSDQDVADDVDPTEDVNSLDPEEAEHVLQEIEAGFWYNTQYGGSVEKKKNKTSFKALFNKPELETRPRPVKPRIFHFYSRRFYQERVKPRVTARWAALSRLENPPKEITMRNAVTKECWASESDAFKAEVEAALESEHKLRWTRTPSRRLERRRPPPRNTTSLNNAAYYLQPFANAAHERYGMNVAILLCGPIPDRGGRIEMRSVHAGMSNGLVPRIWSDFDRGEVECCARSLNGIPMASGDADQAEGMTRASVEAPPPPPPQTTITPAPNPSPSMASPAVSPVLLDRPLGQELLDGLEDQDVRNGGQPLLSFGGERAVSLGQNLLGNGMGDDFDFSSLIPSHMWVGGLPQEPKIGCALGAELTQLPDDERAQEIVKLRLMTEEQVEKANDFARDRLLFARMGRGIPAPIAVDLSSDPEDEGEERERDARRRISRGRQRKAAAQRRRLRPPRRRTCKRRSSHNPTRDRSIDCSGPKRIGRAEGPLQDPGPNPQLQRPEVNREAEGPFARPGASAGGEPTGDEQDAVRTLTGGGDAGRDKEKWTSELVNALWRLRAREDLGRHVVGEVRGALLELEQRHDFPDKGILKAPWGKDERPKEVTDFMVFARRWWKPIPASDGDRIEGERGASLRDGGLGRVFGVGGSSEGSAQAPKHTKTRKQNTPAASVLTPAVATCSRKRKRADASPEGRKGKQPRQRLNKPQTLLTRVDEGLFFPILNSNYMCSVVFLSYIWFFVASGLCPRKKGTEDRSTRYAKQDFVEIRAKYRQEGINLSDTVQRKNESGTFMSERLGLNTIVGGILLDNQGARVEVDSGDRDFWPPAARGASGNGKIYGG